MYKLLLIFCILANICNAQNIKIGKSHNINDTSHVAGILSEAMDSEVAVMHSFFAEQANPADVWPASPRNTRPAISHSGIYADMLVTATSGQPDLYSYRWNADNNRYELISSYTIDGTVSTLAMSRDGEFLILTSFSSASGRNVWTYRRNMANDMWESIATPNTEITPSGFAPVAISANGGRIVAESAGSMRVYNFNGTDYIAANAPNTDFHAAPRYMSISDSGDVLIVGFGVAGGATTFRSWTWNTGANRFEITDEPSLMGGSVNGIGLTADGSRAIVSFDTGVATGGDLRVYDWDGTKFVQVETFELRNPCISADGSVFVAQFLAGSVFFNKTVFYKKINDVYTLMPTAQNINFRALSGNAGFMFGTNNNAFTVREDLLNVIMPAASPYSFAPETSAVGFLIGRGAQGDYKSMLAVWIAPFLQ